MRNTLLLSAGLLVSASSFAAAPSAISVPGYFGSISNNTSYVLSCAHMLGGYCANNPMPANGFIQMLPDPGAKAMHGTLMVLSKTGPKHVIEKIRFNYREQASGKWAFHLVDNAHKVKITRIMPDTLLLGSQKTVATKSIKLGANPTQVVLHNNSSKLTIECAQMLGGYCSRNPISAKQSFRLLPDPGINFIRGHVMVFNPQSPGHYVDNLMMVAKKDHGHWQVKFSDLYGSYGLGHLVASKGH